MDRAVEAKSNFIALGINTIARIILSLRVTLFFYIAYVAVNYVYIILLHQQVFTYVLVFAVSPFNILEILSPVYTSSTQGLVENFGFVVLMILVTETYSRYSAIKLKHMLSIDVVFCLSIGATYITSALWWWRAGVPASGTSIVGFSVLLYLAASSILDLRHQVKRAQKKGREAARGVVWIAACVTSIGFSPTYVWGNPQYALHIAGASIFVLMAVLFAVTRLPRGTHI